MPTSTNDQQFMLRWPSIWRNTPAMLLINTLIGFAYTALLLNWSDIWRSLLSSQCIGFSIFLSILTLHDIYIALGWPQRFRIATTTLLGIPIGFTVGHLLASILLGLPVFSTSHHYLWGSLTFALLGGCFGTFYFAGKTRYLEERRRAEQASRAAAEAQLRGLQAQVEPHFLFNTLATLDALITIDPKQARELLGHLNRYLRSALLHSRNTHTTLGEECALLRAYLQIMETRLPNRLHSQIECPADCVEMPLAPMLLQPLVENAIKHGIEPAAQGGEINIHIQRQEDLLVIEVRDTGVGLAQSGSTCGTGTGLANIRERLLALYGANAQLTLSPLVPQGTLARIAIPMASIQEPAK